MCEQDDLDEFARRASALTRRQFGAMALGAGLAASALGDKATAHRDFVTAYSIDSKQYVVQQALARVYTAHPLTSAQAFSLIVLVE